MFFCMPESGAVGRDAPLLLPFIQRPTGAHRGGTIIWRGRLRPHQCPRQGFLCALKSQRRRSFGAFNQNTGNRTGNLFCKIHHQFKFYQPSSSFLRLGRGLSRSASCICWVNCGFSGFIWEFCLRFLLLWFYPWMFMFVFQSIVAQKFVFFYYVSNFYAGRALM